MSSSFTEKKITVQFILGQGEFEGGGNTATVKDKRVSAKITCLGGVDQGTADVTIYGMPLKLMNQLSNVGKAFRASNLDSIVISAGDDDSMTTVFEGQIYSAFINGQGMPNLSFHVDAKPGFFYKVKPITPTTAEGSGSVESIAKSLATKMGLSFENAGVTARLANPYYWGTAGQQLAALASDAGIKWIIDKGVLAIVPQDKARTGDTATLSASTGMVGYPSFNQNTVMVSALFNSSVKYMGKIKIESELTAACGTFIVQHLVYRLESYTPNGAWFMDIVGIVGDTDD